MTTRHMQLGIFHAYYYIHSPYIMYVYYICMCIFYVCILYIYVYYMYEYI